MRAPGAGARPLSPRPARCAALRSQLQEQRRKQAAQQAAQAAQPPKKKKAWTLEDESDEDEDEGPAPQAASGDVAMADAAEGPSRPPPKAGK